jgi:hypothetical protein
VLDKKQIDGNIEWLLTNGSAPVRYLTHKYLLGTDPGSDIMNGLWADVENCGDAREIFSKQEPDGSWCRGGSWAKETQYVPKDGYTPYTPKYVSAVWVLQVVGDMGFDVRDARVKRACEYVLSYQLPNGLFGRFATDRGARETEEGVDSRNAPCELSFYLLSLGKIGAAGDVRLRKSYDLLVRWQREDGGWVNQFHKEKFNWTRSCPAVTDGAAAALYYSSNPTYEAPLRKALEFLIWHLSIKDEREIQKFFYRWHCTVSDLLMFSETGVGLSERPVQVLLEWLHSMYVPAGSHFEYRGKPFSKFSRRKDGASSHVMKYRLYHLAEDDWLTYYATRIAANLLAF